MREALDRPAGPAVALAVLTALACSLAAAVSDSPRAVLLPVGAAVAALCVGFAVTSFTLFVATLLVVRPVLDVVKSSRDTGFFEPTTAASLVLVLAGAAWLALRRWREGRTPLTPLALAVLVFLLTTALSAVGSVRPTDSLPALLKVGSWTMMFFVVRRLARGRSNARQLLAALALSAVVPLAIGLFGLTAPDSVFNEVKDGTTRLRSTFDQSNNFARYLMLLLLGLIGLLPALPRRWRPGASVLGLVMLVVLVGTYTRSAWTGFAAGLVVLLVLQRRWAALALTTVVAAAVVVLPQPGGVISDRIVPSSGGSASGDSVSWRLGYWSEVAQLVERNPVTGIGPGVTPTQTLEAKEPHNDYLRAVVEGGAVGAFAYLALLAAALWTALRARRAATTGWDRSVADAVVAIMIAHAVASATSNTVFALSYMWYLALLWGVVDARVQVEASTADTNSSPDDPVRSPAPLTTPMRT